MITSVLIAATNRKTGILNAHYILRSVSSYIGFQVVNSNCSEQDLAPPHWAPLRRVYIEPFKQYSELYTRFQRSSSHAWLVWSPLLPHSHTQVLDPL
jgi:hypothetical protein